jgi:hypothetical protein
MSKTPISKVKSRQAHLRNVPVKEEGEKDLRNRF